MISSRRVPITIAVGMTADPDPIRTLSPVTARAALPGAPAVTRALVPGAHLVKESQRASGRWLGTNAPGVAIC
jgi:hypothetical protein